MPPQHSRPEALAWGVFRGSEAVRRGLLTRHQLRGASWRRLRQDVYADSRLPRDHALACRGALLRLPPEALVAGPSAAYLHGVEHAAAFTDDVHVLVPRSARIDSQPGIRVHTVGAACVAPLPGELAPVGLKGGLPLPGGLVPAGLRGGLALPASPSSAAPVDGGAGGSRPGGSAGDSRPSCGAGERPRGGVPAADGAKGLRRTLPAQAAWESAAWLDPVPAVAVVDGLLRMGLTSPAALTAIAEHNADRPGGRRARWVFGLADAGAQSPPESHLRVRLVLAGLPRPVTRHPVRVASGRVLHPDLAWPDFRVAVEHDGQWHADADQLHRDRQRLNHLVGAGWLVLHVTGQRLQRDFPGVVREVRAALVARGWRR
jgi:hypothetical protein